jgi:6-phosphogluconolactonase (cycloisomerase 2 family)
MEMVSLL